jgi:hypothetical protein
MSKLKERSVSTQGPGLGPEICLRESDSDYKSHEEEEEGETFDFDQQFM